MKSEEEVLEIIESIATEIAEKGGRMYFIGGYVRDRILKRSSSDIDLRSIRISKNQFKRILEKYGKVSLVKSRYPIFKIEGLDIDFATPIDDDKRIKTEEDLICGVDFTINSILQDVLTGDFVDYYHGIEDIEKRCIRIARDSGNDEFIAVRAARFKAKLGCPKDNKGNERWFEIDDNSKGIMRGYSFENVSYERLYPEMKKVMDGEGVVQSVFFRELLDLGVLEKLLAPLGCISGLEVDSHGRKVDAFEHTMRMLDYVMQFKDELDAISSQFDGGKRDFFAQIYMTCLTYYFRLISENKDEALKSISQFFIKINSNSDARKYAEYFLNNEETLMDAYEKFSRMSDEEFMLEASKKELVNLYKRHKEKLEVVGYLAETFNMTLSDSIIPEQKVESGKRLRVWKERISVVREMSPKKSVPPNNKRKKSKPKKGGGTKLRSSGKRKQKYDRSFSMGDLGDFTADIGVPEIEKFASNSTKRYSRTWEDYR